MNINEEITNYVAPNIGLVLKPIIIIAIMSIIISSTERAKNKRKEV